MKRIFVFTVLILSLHLTSLISQEKKQNQDEVVSPRSSMSKIGGAGGFTAFWLFANVDPINEYLVKSYAAPLDKNGFPLYGGQGYGYIMFIKNLRVGGMGAGGSLKSKSISGNTERAVELSVACGGVTVEYVIPVLSRLDVAIGGMLGGGGIDLKITRDENFRKKWENIFNEFGATDPVQEYTRMLSGSFFIYQPSINVEYAVLRWIGLRAGVSYLGMTGGKWTMDDRFEVYGVPDDISGKGWMINAGIFLGTFVY